VRDRRAANRVKTRRARIRAASRRTHSRRPPPTQTGRSSGVMPALTPTMPTMAPSAWAAQQRSAGSDMGHAAALRRCHPSHSAEASPRSAPRAAAMPRPGSARCPAPPAGRAPARRPRNSGTPGRPACVRGCAGRRACTSKGPRLPGLGGHRPTKTSAPTVPSFVGAPSGAEQVAPRRSHAYSRCCDDAEPGGSCALVACRRGPDAPHRAAPGHGAPERRSRTRPQRSCAAATPPQAWSDARPTDIEDTPPPAPGSAALPPGPRRYAQPAEGSRIVLRRGRRRPRTERSTAPAWEPISDHLPLPPRPRDRPASPQSPATASSRRGSRSTPGPT
jgi:hypothetical protein